MGVREGRRARLWMSFWTFPRAYLPLVGEVPAPKHHSSW